MPKKVLFGWLPKTRPACGPRRRWRDVIRRDLKSLSVPEEHWYNAALHRSNWRDIYNDKLEAEQHQQQLRLMPSQGQVQCQECRRMFQREADKSRHKCTDERKKPICEQRGAVQCAACCRWFRSKGGLSVHRCGLTTNPDPNTSPNSSPTSRSENRTRSRARHVAPFQSSRPVQCQQCERWFRRPSDQARHKCIAERMKPVQDQHGSVQCVRCENWFLSQGGLAVHRCEANNSTENMVYNPLLLAPPCGVA